MPKTNLVAEPGKQEIIVTRVFDLPRELLFKAFTDPKSIPQWWGPKRFTTTVERMEVRKGGVWRFVQRDANGKEHAFNGVYHEITPSERLVHTFEYEGTPGEVLLETVTFEERGGKTTLRDQAVFQSVANRDRMLEEGMQEGAVETMDRLERLLKAPRKTP